MGLTWKFLNHGLGQQQAPVAAPLQHVQISPPWRVNWHQGRAC